MRRSSIPHPNELPAEYMVSSAHVAVQQQPVKPVKQQLKQ